jgi:hypothetical protein
MNCKACNSFAQWGIDNICKDFLDEYWDYEKNTVDPWKINYGTNNKEVWIKCKNIKYHESYHAKCDSFTIKNSKCPYCYNKKVHPLDSIGHLHAEIFEIWSEKNKKSPYEYAPNSGKEVWFKCREGKHEDYIRNIKNSNTLNFKCPMCQNERKESMLQEKVRLYLISLGFSLLHEYKCNIKCINPKTNHILPYDNEVPTLNLIIEVHGEQHYTKNKGWMKTNKEFEYLKWKDQYKKDYAISQGYSYLELSFKNIIDNKYIK